MVANLISGLALLVSLGTFLWGRSTEKRLRNVADRKSAFDAWLLAPLEAQIAVVSQVLGEMASAIREIDDPQKQAETLRALQKGRFGTWCADIFAYCDSQSDEVLTDVVQGTSDLIDEVSDQMNAFQDATTDHQLENVSRKLLSAKHSYVAKVRLQLQAARIAIK